MVNWKWKKSNYFWANINHNGINGKWSVEQISSVFSGTITFTKGKVDLTWLRTLDYPVGWGINW